MPFCPDCGTEVSEDIRFCPECGRRLATGQTTKRTSKTKIAGIIIGCIIAVIVTAVVATHPPTSTKLEPAIPAHFATYTNELGLFSISYPREWVLFLDRMGELWEVTREIIRSIDADLPVAKSSLLFAAGLPSGMGHMPNAHVVVVPFSGQTPTHDAAAAAWVESLKAFVPDYQELSRVKTIVDGRTAIIIESQGTWAGLGSVRYVQMILFVKKTVWVVTCGALSHGYSEWEDDLHAIVRSLRIFK